MKVLIIGNGDISELSLIEEILNGVDFIICADGGASHLSKINVIPNVIIGDLDSIDKKVLKKFKNLDVKFLKFPAKKNKTDTELAIDYGLELGADEFILAGVTGKRMDHTLGNIFLLYKLLKEGKSGKIIDEQNEIFISDNNLTLDKKENSFISIIPITKEVIGLTLEGFKYETTNINLEFSTTMGISNEIKDEKGHISLENGICLVIRSRD